MWPLLCRMLRLDLTRFFFSCDTRARDNMLISVLVLLSVRANKPESALVYNVSSPLAHSPCGNWSCHKEEVKGSPPGPPTSPTSPMLPLSVFVKITCANATAPQILESMSPLAALTRTEQGLNAIQFAFDDDGCHACNFSKQRLTRPSPPSPPPPLVRTC